MSFLFNASSRSNAAVLGIATVALSAGPLRAQQAETIEDFSIEVMTGAAGQDSSFAVLWPDGGVLSPTVSSGLVSIACGRDSAALAGTVMLPAGGATGDTVVVAVQFGDAIPDTLVLEGGEEVSNQWYLRDRDVVPFFRGAHEADSLRVELLSAATPRARTRFAYGLAGIDTAMSRLGCVVAEPGPGRLAGRRILGGNQTLETSAVQYPRLLNGDDTRRYMHRHYPRLYRDAGVPGQVVVRFRVLEDGRVDPASITVVRSTFEEFHDAAIGTVRQMRFTPPTGYGRPIKLWTEMPLLFTPR
jgi:TonB family protein